MTDSRTETRTNYTITARAMLDDTDMGQEFTPEDAMWLGVTAIDGADDAFAMADVFARVILDHYGRIGAGVVVVLAFGERARRVAYDLGDYKSVNKLANRLIFHGAAHESATAEWMASRC